MAHTPQKHQRMTQALKIVCLLNQLQAEMDDFESLYKPAYAIKNVSKKLSALLAHEIDRIYSHGETLSDEGSIQYSTLTNAIMEATNNTLLDFFGTYQEQKEAQFNHITQ